MAQWKTVLKNRVYKKLETIVKNTDKMNEERINKDPYVVCRGSILSNIVENLFLGNDELFEKFL